MTLPVVEEIAHGYRLWRDPLTGHWRFAGPWRDDGFGGALHGARPTRGEAVAAAEENHAEHEQMRSAG